MNKNEQRLRELWDTITCTNKCVIGVPLARRKVGEKEENLFQKMAENFPNFLKNINLHIQYQQTPFRINHSKNIKVKDKEKILKVER